MGRLAEVGVGVPLGLALALHAGVHLVQSVINNQTDGEVLLLLRLVDETSGTNGHPLKADPRSLILPMMINGAPLMLGLALAPACGMPLGLATVLDLALLAGMLFPSNEESLPQRAQAEVLQLGVAAVHQGLQELLAQTAPDGAQHTLMRLP